MPLWFEPELCLEYKGVQVYRQVPGRYLYRSVSDPAAAKELAVGGLAERYGAADLVDLLRAAIDQGVLR